LPKQANKAGPKQPWFLKDRFDLMFFVIVMTLLTVGLVMLLSASYAYASSMYGDSFRFINRQGQFAVLGVVLMLFISRINYKKLRKLALPLYLLSIVLLIIVMFLPRMDPDFDYKRWIYIRGIPFNFQPSELAKFSIVLLFSHLIDKDYARMKNFWVGIFQFLVFLGAVCALVVIEPHLSATIVIFALGLVLMIVGGANLKHLGLISAGVAAVAGVVLVVFNKISYVRDRFIYWWDPWEDIKGKGWQVIQSLYAIGSGGVLGQGIGNSRQKYLYVSEPHNDFVFAIVCEELGFVGAIAIIALFSLLVWRGFVIALRAPDKFSSLLAVGLTFQVGLQAAFNIMVVTNTIPNTGISLPFFSYGGSSLVMLLMQMGVILSISRCSNLQKT